jgi:ATP-binding cassette subfamily C protein
MADAGEFLAAAAPVEPAPGLLRLDGGAAMWLVEAGALDLFLQRGGAGGTGSGARHPLYRVLQGQIAAGPAAGALPADWSLVGVPVPGTILRTFACERLAAALAAPASAAPARALVDDWVSASMRAAPRRAPARACALLAPGAQVESGAGDLLSHGARVAWLALAEGEVRWLGHEGCRLDAGAGVLPLTREAFVECAGAVRGTLREAPPGDADALAAALRLHARLVLGAALGAIAEAEAAQARRLAGKAQSAADATRAALARLMAAGGAGTADAASGRGGERLLAALQPVGACLGIAFRAPPPADAAAFARDPVATVCAASDVRHRQVALKEGWWESDSGPLLATLGDGREWVALLPLKARRYELFDPASGRREVVTEALAQRLGPFATCFYRPFPARALDALDLLRFGLSGLGADLRRVAALSVAAGLLGMATPVAVGSLIDDVIPAADATAIWQWVGALAAAALAGALFGVARAIAMLRLEGRMDNAVQAAVWDRVLKLPVPFFRAYTHGDLAMRINGINVIRHALSGSTLQTALTGLFSLFNLILLFHYSVRLAVVVLGLTACALAVAGGIGVLKLRCERRLASLAGHLAGVTLQYLRGIAKIRVAAAETSAFANWAALFADYRGLAFRSQHLSNIEATFSAGFQPMLTAALFAAIGMTLFEPGAARMSTGDFVAFNAAFGVFFGGMMQLAQTVLSLTSLVPVYERARPILTTLPEVGGARGHPGEIQGGIEVSKLAFAYGDGPRILSEVSFSIRPGGYIALVGPSGSGKSTLFRLLLGFEKPTSGSIAYDGHDIADLDLHALRRQFGVVLQGGQLIPGDVYGNIVGAANLPLEAAWEAARMVGLAEDIEQMPMGMHTVIGEGASTLSGGQRQRILIARAIVHRPRVLFFDEATSALDNRTQAVVTQSLDRLKSTRIVIAHRLSTVINADRILVLKDGRIVQEGNYAKLMAQEGPFRDLAQRQIA